MIKRFKIPRKLNLVFKWTMVLVVVYFIFDAIYVGLGSVDTKTGLSSFYWSGMDDLKKPKKPHGLLIDEPYPTFFKGEDGPYVFGNDVYFINANENLIKQTIDSSRRVTVRTNLKEMPFFVVALREGQPVEQDHYEMPDSLVAISDLEGNLTGFYSLLLSNKIIDKNGNWIFGAGSLVLNGDFMDRGEQVTQLLWFIYFLEHQALKNGGKVHFILGNHEIMNLYGNASDNDFKYVEAAKRISRQSRWDEALRYLYSEKSVLGSWLRTKNIIEKIGDNIFVHGGLNKYHFQGKYSIAELNAIARKYFGIGPEQMQHISEREKLIVGNPVSSPYWDRRLNHNWKVKLSYITEGVLINATSQDELEEILKFYTVEKVIIGHSNVDQISASYGNKVILLDVAHGNSMHSGRTKGLLIQNGNFYKLDDKGNKSILFGDR